MRVGNHRKRILSLPNVRLGAFEKDEKTQASVSQTDKDGESKTIRERSIGTVLYRFSDTYPSFYYRFETGEPLASIDPAENRASSRSFLRSSSNSTEKKVVSFHLVGDSELRIRDTDRYHPCRRSK